MGYAIRGLSKSGEGVWYTGKAGSAFVGKERAEAFVYESLEGARRRAMMLNRGMELHGWYFMVPVGEGK